MELYNVTAFVPSLQILLHYSKLELSKYTTIKLLSPPNSIYGTIIHFKNKINLPKYKLYTYFYKISIIKLFLMLTKKIKTIQLLLGSYIIFKNETN